MRILVRFFLIASVLVSAVKVAAQDAPASSGPARQESPKTEAAKGDYVLQPQDLIKVQVFQEDEINHLGEVRISQEYTVIRGLYDHDYIVNPQVSVIVLEYAKRYVNVLGAVNTPGVVTFPPEEGLSLIEAVTRAGGFARIADKKHVTLKRTNADGKTETSTINADDLMKGRTDDTWPLQPGDVISVGEIIF